MAGEEHEQPGGWEPTGWPGGHHRLVMVDPYMRLMVDKGPTWNVTIGWPGVCAIMKRGRAADEAGAKLAAESEAAAMLRELAGRCAVALSTLGTEEAPAGAAREERDVLREKLDEAQTALKVLREWNDFERNGLRETRDAVRALVGAGENTQTEAAVRAVVEERDALRAQAASVDRIGAVFGAPPGTSAERIADEVLKAVRAAAALRLAVQSLNESIRGVL